MALIQIDNITMEFGFPPLFENISLQIEKGERICILGRNGSGKSTFLKLLNGEIPPDKGEIRQQEGLRMAILPQEVPQEISGTVIEIIASGVQKNFSSNSAPHDHGMEADHGEWQSNHRAEQVTSQMGLSLETDFKSLSAGQKRSVLLARAVASQPDILFLDEPTNHLDIDSINRLEEFLLRSSATLVFVTHDRTFLRKLATRILEIDRGRITSWNCDYDTYLQRKQEALDAEMKQWALFDKKLSQEEIWLRQGIKARRTRNEGRVRALEEMRAIRQKRRERIGTVRLQSQEAERSGKLVIEAKMLSYTYGKLPVIRNFSTTIMRGDKIGIIGPNGCGKSTLLLLLLGLLPPQNGTVRFGTNLEIAYFDQLRAQLDEARTVQENVGEGKEMLTINGRQRHITGYLQDFLFTPDQARTPVAALSGGERNRVLLARLFSRPFNLLVMDEPTNDLDIEAIEILEELLIDYPGTLLLVSHDRTFLNNIVSSTLVFEGEGTVSEYIGGYDDWRREQRLPAEAKKEEAKKTKPRPPKDRLRKLTYKEQKDLEALPCRIEELEKEQKRLYDLMAEPSFYQQTGEEIASTQRRLEALEEELAEAYTYWEILEELAAAIS